MTAQTFRFPRRTTSDLQQFDGPTEHRTDHRKDQTIPREEIFSHTAKIIVTEKMTAQQPLVRGDVYEQEWHQHGLEPSFVTMTPPDIDHNTMIVAAASPSVTEGSPSLDGWFLSDFYAFNYLFKGLGHSQTWLAAAVSSNPRPLDCICR